MKHAELMALGLAAVAVYMIVTKGKSNSHAASLSGTYEVFDANGERFSNGWRYFTDGTSIDPQGNYFNGGQLVYKAP